ncbi:MAG: virulence protein RhuM/Fic/DOC family protein [Gammaproteobacteria bacterium]|nr:virulence protein RhuM/Fic/DOC family protein [Gammaproteobacteria bacterium]
MNDINIYQSDNGNVEVRVSQDTVWLSQDQMTAVFGVQKAAVSKHLKNIYSTGELTKEATVSKMETVQREGNRLVMRQIEHFNLDVVISIGYRVNSVQATRFRQWATGVLREHLTKGYSINRQRFEENARELEAALVLVKKTAQNPELLTDEGRGLVDIVTRYTQTFLWLQRYDDGLLADPPQQVGGKLLTTTQARKALATLKANLIIRGEATIFFAQERADAFDALLGNLEQTIANKPAYPTVESKAAHLLYFVIKNHPFFDGNKRSGAFLFVDFLYRNGRLFNKDNQPVINDVGLAALALLIAESNPANKDTMIRLIISMLSVAITSKIKSEV